MIKFLRSFYIERRTYFAALVVVLFCVAGFGWPLLLVIGQLLLAVLALAVLAEVLAVYAIKEGVLAARHTTKRWSNGDENLVELHLQNNYKIDIRARVLDELPVQFQERGNGFTVALSAGQTHHSAYMVRPVERGVYTYGAINIFVSSKLGLVSRRYKIEQGSEVAVYPSFIQMRKYELLAISNRLTLQGIKKVRRIAHMQEFEQIKEYVPGDDHRAINWKATARKGQLMVDQFQDERAQQVYSVLDMGRVMQLPFEGLSLLDYAINAALVISNIAIKKQDKAGLITVSHKLQNVLKAERKPDQMGKIMEVLYRQKTQFLETNHEAIYLAARHHVRHRSLLLYYTNFETLNALQRQLPFMARLAKQHLLVVIFFKNTELDTDLKLQPATTEEVYTKTITEKHVFEKRLVVKELERYGIMSVLTRPQDLNVDLINKYLELKARALI